MSKKKSQPEARPGYWRAAAAELKSVKMLVLCAMFCALSVAISSLFVTVGENLYIYFTCFVNAVACAVCGPVLAVLYAIAQDTLSFFLFSTGGYFPGYLLSAVLGDVIYALFLYRRRITVGKLFAAKFLVNYGVNVALGALWSSVLYGKGYLYYLFRSLVKNTILLPFEVAVMAALFAVLLPAFSRLSLLPAIDEADRKKLRLGHSTLLIFAVQFSLCAIACGYYAGAMAGGSVFVVIAACAGVCAAACVAGQIALRRRRKNGGEAPVKRSRKDP